jgi:hypothetical protein
MKSLRVWVFVGVLLILTLPVWAATTVNLAAAKDEAKLVQNDDFGFSFQCAFSKMEAADVSTQRGMFAQISIPELEPSHHIGEPMLPVLRRLITAPIGATVTANVVRSDRQEIKLADYGITSLLMPAQPSLSKSQRPEDVPFEYHGPAYAQSGFGNEPLVHVEEVGMMRGVRVLALEVDPVRYDPTTHKVEVYNNLEVRVNFAGGDLAATDAEHARTYSPIYEGIYGAHLLNYRSNGRFDDDLTRYPIKYVIIANSMFANQIQSFAEWKTKQGYKVIIGYRGDANCGNTATTIKAYLQTLYNNGTPSDPAPTYVLFVGDTTQIPTWYGGAGSHYTDNTYVRLSGTDYITDVYYGRFSATDTTTMRAIVDKNLRYEKYQMADPSYLGRCVMIAGVDAGGHSPTWGNGQINYGTTYYFNTAHGLTSDTYLYPASGSSQALIIANANAGRGYMNYTAHGGETGWSEPSFSVTDANAMTNTDKFGLMVGNCCLTNSFQVGTCFGEALLRQANKGAVGYIGASNYSYWDEDFWWGSGFKTVATNPVYDAATPGAYDGMFHDHGEVFAKWYTTQYSFIMAGDLAVEQSTSSLKTYYWEVYQLMGDPSALTYLGVPTAQTVSYPSAILIGQTSINVSAEAYSYVGLSLNGVLAASGLVGSGGSITLTFTGFTSVGNADIVITRQNRIPIISTIQVVPNSGPWVSLDSYSPTSATYGATVNINATLKNLGSVTANSVNATLALTSPYITITDNSQAFGNIASGATATQNNAFALQLASNVPDQTSLHFTVTVTDNLSNSWPSYLDLMVNAPVPAAGTASINDAAGNGNGRIDPGETVLIIVPINNTGHAATPAGTATLTTTSGYITINTGTANLAAIAASGYANATFTITAAAGTPIGTSVPFHVVYTAGSYGTTSDFSRTVGLVVDDFESNSFNTYRWQSGGTLPWTIVNTGAYEGTYCAKSGAITDGQTSDMKIDTFVAAAGSISFYYKVSSESGYDYLQFFIDGVQQTQWSGEVAWTQATYALTTGHHVLLWRYLKDGSLSNGSDCAWVDYVVFPQLSGPIYPHATINPTSFAVTLLHGDTTSRLLTIGNTGPIDLTYSIATATSTLFVMQNPPDIAVDLPKDGADTHHGRDQLDNLGGPDAFGYIWKDSRETGGPTYSWVELASIGTAQTFTTDDQTLTVTLPFSFPFYGTNYTTGNLSSNGNLHFGTASTSYSNVGIPNTAVPNAMIAPFWDDLSPQNSYTHVYTYNDVANSRYIVQFDTVSHYGTTYPGNYTFEMILYSSGRIVFQYQNVTGTVNNCSVGIENAAGSVGLQVVYNAAFLVNNLAVQFTPPIIWLSVSPTSGTVAASGNATPRVRFDATQLSDGTYNGTLTVTTNDPQALSTILPVTLTVGGPPAAVEGLTILKEATGMRLRWNASAMATGYNIYRSNTYPVTAVPGNLLTSVATTNYLDNTTLGVHRYYLVTATR